MSHVRQQIRGAIVSLLASRGISNVAEFLAYAQTTASGVEVVTTRDELVDGSAVMVDPYDGGSNERRLTVEIRIRVAEAPVLAAVQAAEAIEVSAMEALFLDQTLGGRAECLMHQESALSVAGGVGETPSAILTITLLVHYFAAPGALDRFSS